METLSRREVYEAEAGIAARLLSKGEPHAHLALRAVYTHDGPPFDDAPDAYCVHELAGMDHPDEDPAQLRAALDTITEALAELGALRAQRLWAAIADRASALDGDAILDAWLTRKPASQTLAQHARGMNAPKRIKLAIVAYKHAVQQLAREEAWRGVAECLLWYLPKGIALEPYVMVRGGALVIGGYAGVVLDADDTPLELDPEPA